MNFDEIENLSEENINELYEDIIEGNSDKISVCVCSGCTHHRIDKSTDTCAPYPPNHNVYLCYSHTCSDLGCEVFTPWGDCVGEGAYVCTKTYSIYGVCR